MFSVKLEVALSCQSKLMFYLILGSMVVRWLAMLPHSKKALVSGPGWGLSVWTWQVLPVLVWVLSRNSEFLKDMLVRLFGDSKLPVGVDVIDWLSISLSQPCASLVRVSSHPLESRDRL